MPNHEKLARKIYVASSWRNGKQPAIVRALRNAGHEVYDFRHPAPGNDGFHWSAVDPAWQSWNAETFRAGLQHPVAVEGFLLDWRAMLWADACVLVMPCGRSAHLELGYFVGAGKTALILLEDGEPELMYKMAHICTSMEEVHRELGAGQEAGEVVPPASAGVTLQSPLSAAPADPSIITDTVPRAALENVHVAMDGEYAAIVAHDPNGVMYMLAQVEVGGDQDGASCDSSAGERLPLREQAGAAPAAPIASAEEIVAKLRSYDYSYESGQWQGGPDVSDEDAAELLTAWADARYAQAREAARLSDTLSGELGLTQRLLGASDEQAREAWRLATDLDGFPTASGNKQLKNLIRHLLQIVNTPTKENPTP